MCTRRTALDALSALWILSVSSAWLVQVTQGNTNAASSDMNQINVAGLVCGVAEQNVTSSFQVTHAQLGDETQPHILTIMRSGGGATDLTITVRDADGIEVLPTSPYAVTLESLSPRLRRLRERQLNSPPRGRRAASAKTPPRRRRASPPPRRRRASSSGSSSASTPRRRRAAPSAKPGPRRRVAAARPPTPLPPPTSANTDGGYRRRASLGIQGQSYPQSGNTAYSSTSDSVHRRRVQPYGYSNQQTLNNNYGGQSPSSTSYGYSGANAYPQNNAYRNAAVIGGAMVGGAVVGAGAMYLWNRLGERRSNMYNRLSSRGARSGEVTISLQWFNKADMDLWVYPPRGVNNDVCDRSQKIYFANRRMDGGWLDVDANAGRKVNDPVENVVFEYGRKGKYCVVVDCYSGPCENFEVIIRSVARVSNQDWGNGEVWEEDATNGNQGTMVYYCFGANCQNGVQGFEGFGTSKDPIDVCTFDVTDLPTRQHGFYCFGRGDRDKDIMNCDDCRELFDVDCQIATCAGGQNTVCPSTTKSDLNRDDLMEAMFVPEHFKTPFEVTIDSLQGDDFTNAICQPTARQPQLFLLVSEMSSLDTDNACVIDLDLPCTAPTTTGCYDNEVCDGDVCVCEPGACLDENFLCEFAMQDNDVSDARMTAVLGVPLLGRLVSPVVGLAIYVVLALV